MSRTTISSSQDFKRRGGVTFDRMASDFFPSGRGRFVSAGSWYWINLIGPLEPKLLAMSHFWAGFDTS